jgi:antibiotic biosynthesis monooxygenase (ABM) superfamily enzyme
MSKPTRFTRQHEVADRGSGRGWTKIDRGRAPLHIERQLVKLARILLGWLAAFLIVLALFAVFGEQLEAMPLQLRALTMSGALIIAMNFLVMPTITRLLSRFSLVGTGPETESVR